MLDIISKKLLKLLPIEQLSSQMYILNKTLKIIGSYEKENERKVKSSKE